MSEYRGVDGVAREVVKKWRGVSNVARNITAEWRGVSNVARQFFRLLGMLYGTGNECESVTGGWDAYYNDTSGWWNGYSSQGTRNSDHIYIEKAGSSKQVKSVATTNKVSTVGFTNLWIDVEMQSLTGDATFQLQLRDSLTDDFDNWAKKYGWDINSYSSERQTICMTDIPQGNYYVTLACTANSGSYAVKIHSVWFE